ncbi:hypothetical protein L3Q82_002519 [Scortum barcoo]|uniref:Uncharacterized protein n=1 Tax=Scortum barcoo TaxID=214431 RepID=A0ACB8VYZ7_9TELE|nr:hypothetical protein L3Q82_002519 [Scortum barcoo]
MSHPEGGPGEDPGHAGETMSLGWPGNASGSPRKSWRKCLGESSGAHEYPYTHLGPLNLCNSREGKDMGIQAITDYKPSNSTPTVMNVSFLNELNDFYARFDKDNKDMIIKPKPSDDHQTLTLSPTDVQNALSQINARKAAGP